MSSILLILALHGWATAPALAPLALDDPPAANAAEPAAPSPSRNPAAQPEPQTKPPVPPSPGRAGRGATNQPPSPQGGTSEAKGPGTPSQPPAPLMIGMCRLKFADAENLARIIRGLCPDTAVICDKRTNSVMYSGTEETNAKVARIAVELDREIPEGQDERGANSVQTIPIQHRVTEEVAHQLQMILSGRNSDLRIAADPARSLVLLSGAPAETDAARAVIARLDTPVTSVQLEFTFLYTDPPGVGTTPKAVPPELESIVKELKRFGEVDLLGRFSTVATGDFKIAGTVMPSEQAVIEGQFVQPVASSGSVTLRLRAKLCPVDNTGAKREGVQPTFDLETVVMVDRGDYVVIGSAATGSVPGASRILVLHVVGP